MKHVSNYCVISYFVSLLLFTFVPTLVGDTCKDMRAGIQSWDCVLRT
jgi:hypothetical protein